jgi:hypothetical protein
MLPVEQRAWKNGKIIAILIEMSKRNASSNSQPLLGLPPDPLSSYANLRIFQIYVVYVVNYVLFCPDYVFGTTLTAMSAFLHSPF